MVQPVQTFTIQFKLCIKIVYHLRITYIYFEALGLAEVALMTGVYLLMCFDGPRASLLQDIGLH